MRELRLALEFAACRLAVPVQPARLASVQHEPSISAGLEPGLGLLERRLRYHRWSIEAPWPRCPSRSRTRASLKRTSCLTGDVRLTLRARAADIRDRPARGRRGLADRRHHRRVPSPAGPPRRARADVGRRRDRGRALHRRRGRAGDRRPRLPQRQQEGLETVVAAVAVGMVTFMIVWMRRHARDLASELRAKRRRSALARGLGLGARRDGVLRRPARGPRDRGLPARRVPGLGRRRSSAGARRAARHPRRRRDRLWASTAAASSSTSPASSASPPSCSCSSPPDSCVQRAAHRARGGVAQQLPGAGRRPRAGSSARHRSSSSLLTGVLGLQPQPDGRRGRRLAPLRHPDADLRALARRRSTCACPARSPLAPDEEGSTMTRLALVIGVAARLPRASPPLRAGSRLRRRAQRSSARTVPPERVAVTLTDAGCSPAEAAPIPAGAVTFDVTNAGTAKVTEVELKNAGRR